LKVILNYYLENEDNDYQSEYLERAYLIMKSSSVKYDLYLLNEKLEN